VSRLDLGVGLALMPGLVDEIDSVRGLVDCLEVEPQTFWLETGDTDHPFRLEREELHLVTKSFDAILAHGVTSPVGGSRPPSQFMVSLFQETVSLLNAQLTSEHLSFNESTVDGSPFTSAFFLPPRQTWMGVDAAIESIRTLRSSMAIPFSVESPVSYLRPRNDEMQDGAFMAAVADGADCGILLDLHNVWTNQRNGRQTVREYVSQLPVDRVWEVHVAGGLERRGFWLDAHSGMLDEELLAIAADVLPLLPNVRAVVYEILPEFLVQDGRNVLRADLEAVQRLVANSSRTGVRASNRGTAPRPSAPSGVTSPEESSRHDPHVWEQAVALGAIGRCAPSSSELPCLDEDPGIALLQELVGAGRNGRVASSLTLTIELLVLLHGIDRVNDLLDDYAASTLPALWGSQEGLQFANWVLSTFPDDELVRSAVLLDRAGLDAIKSECQVTVDISVNPTALIAMVRNRVECEVPRGRFVVSVGQ
jgi:uncharacterized protein